MQPALLITTAVIACAFFTNSITLAEATSKISVADFTKATEGATKFITALRKGDFVYTMKTVIEVASPWLGKVGPLLKMGSDLFLPGPPTEAQIAKEQFLKINGKLDYLTLKQEETNQLISYSFMRARFSGLESSIQTLTNQYNGVMQDNTTDHIRNFLKTCQGATLELALNELYQSVQRKNQIFSDNIIKVSQLYTKYSRKQVQHFMLGVLEIFLKGFELRLAELALDGMQLSFIESEKNTWINKLQEIKTAMEEADKFMMDNYKVVFKQDLKDQITIHRTEENVAFAVNLEKFFEEKYYWFYVFVQVFKKSVEVGHQSSARFCEDPKVVDIERGKNEEKDTEVVVLLLNKEHRDANKPSIANINYDLESPGLFEDPDWRLAEYVKNKIGSEMCKSYVYVSAVWCDDNNRERSNAPYARNVPGDSGTGFWAIPNDNNNFSRMDCHTIGCNGKRAWLGGGGSCTPSRDCRFCHRLVYF